MCEHRVLINSSLATVHYVYNIMLLYFLNNKIGVMCTALCTLITRYLIYC